MKDINKLKNYRTKFKRYYNIDFSSDYAIHHIDLNHDNNEIENLLLLPRELHNQYHFYLNATDRGDGYKFFRRLTADIKGNFAGNSYERQMFIGLLETLNECSKWYDFKMFLDGDLPNIHNIELR